MVITTENKFNKWYLISVLIVFRYLIPTYFDNMLELYPLIEKAIALIPLLAGMVFLLNGGFTLNFTAVPFALLYVCYIISTYLNHGAVGSVIIHSCHVLMLCFVAEKMAADDEKADSFLRAVRDVTLLFFVTNYVVTIIYPRGIPAISEPGFPYFFYGNMNSTIRYIMPGLCCSFLLDARKNRKATLPTFLFAFGIAENALRIYMTATALVAVLFIFAWVFCKRILAKKVSWVYLAELLVMAFFEITVVIRQSNAGLISFVTGVFHKDLDFSGRARLWHRATELVSGNSIWGLGFRDREFLHDNIGNTSGAHNYFLDIAVQRGLIGVAIFIVIIVIPFVLIRNADITDEQYIMLGCTGTCYIMFLFEPFYTTEYLIIPIIYMMISLLLNSRPLRKTVFIGRKI